MSLADNIFVDMCSDILENGTSTENEVVRPHWPDGTPAYTIKKFGVVNRYDLRKEFPALTLRKTALKLAMDEILWIYQRKSNNVHYLASHIWDEWADSDGKIGKAYGYQMGKKYYYKEVTKEGLDKAFSAEYYMDGFEYYAYDKKTGHIYAVHDGYTEDGKDMWKMDQMDKVLYDLKNTPFSRRIITSIWNPAEQSEMALAPCAYSLTFNVTEEDGKLVLNAVLNQRSQDVLAANNWNVAQYSILLMMVARAVGMVPGELVHVIADAHIYDRHVDIVKELIKRDRYEAPKVSLRESVSNFYEFTTDDLLVENYNAGEQVKNIPIAV